MAKAKYIETTEQADLKRRKKEAEKNKNVGRFGDVKDPKDSPLDEGVYKGTDPDHQTRLYVELDGEKSTPAPGDGGSDGGDNGNGDGDDNGDNGDSGQQSQPSAQSSTQSVQPKASPSASPAKPAAAKK